LKQHSLNVLNLVAQFLDLGIWLFGYSSTKAWAHK